MEQKVEDNSLKIKQKQDKLYNIKTNKEYTALIHEIDTTKEENMRLEDDILELMENTEEIDKKIKELDKTFRRVETIYRSEFQKTSSHITSLQETIRKLQKEENAVAEELKNQSLSLYNEYTKLINCRTGLAVAKMENGVCTACRISLPPQLSCEIRKGTNIQRCPNCHRILYHPTNN